MDSIKNFDFCAIKSQQSMYLGADDAYSETVKNGEKWSMTKS